MIQPSTASSWRVLLLSVILFVSLASGWAVLAVGKPPHGGPDMDQAEDSPMPAVTPSPETLFGTGGVVRIGMLRMSDPSFLPMFCAESVCRNVNDLIYPHLWGLDVMSGAYQVQSPGGMAVGLESSADGRQHTIKLRRDWLWSDGQPVTAADFLYAWDAYQALAYYSGFVRLDINSVASVTAPDPYTLDVRLSEAGCPALEALGGLLFMPAHALSADYGRLETSADNLDPDVTSGVFLFQQYDADRQIINLVPNPAYPDASLGAVVPSGLEIKIYDGTDALVEAFMRGEYDVSSAVDSFQIGVDLNLEGIRAYHYAGDSWEYMGLNLADPLIPREGQDTDGQSIAQGYHPLFGDARVRQAMALAIDVDNLLASVLDGKAVRLASNMMPYAWAYDASLPPVGFDPEQAKALLLEAGWRDDDGDGFLEAHNALHAPDGTPFVFTALIPAHSAYRIETAEVIRKNLEAVGIRMNTQPMDFVAFLDALNTQSFDAYFLGWADVFPHNPDQPYWSPAADVLSPGGLNFTSYSNPQLNALMDRARTTAGCDFRERIPYYRQIQRILQEDMPYIWLYARTETYLAQGSLEGFDPLPHRLFWNVDTWRVAR